MPTRRTTPPRAGFALAVAAVSTAGLWVPAQLGGGTPVLEVLAEAPGYLVAIVLGGWSGALLDRRRRRCVPDGPTADDTPPLPLGTTERAVWVSRDSDRPKLVLGVALVAGAVLGAPIAVGLLNAVTDQVTALSVSLALLLVGLLTLQTATVRSRVSGDGLDVAYGPWSWPVRRIPLDEIRAAHTTRPTVRRFAGRGRPGGPVTFLVRGGPALLVRDADGADHTIGAADAPRAAALLNALRARNL